MDFTKMHGLGNDFIVIDNRDGRLSSAKLAGLAPALCRRNFCIGADGLAILGASAVASFRMQIFNADGSEPEMCGNAIRCLGKYIWERGLLKEETFSLETGAGIKEIKLILQGQKVAGVRVDMGFPVLASEKIPLAGPPRQAVEEKILVEKQELHFTAVSMGNPHCVIFVPELEKIPWRRWGTTLEYHPLFPNRTNSEFVEIADPARVNVKVWERGAGATLACGTGACAVVVAGVLTGRLANVVAVSLPGGVLQISWEKGGKVYMEGPAEEVFRGSVKTENLVEEAG